MVIPLPKPLDARYAERLTDPRGWEDATELGAWLFLPVFTVVPKSQSRECLLQAYEDFL